MNLVDADNLRKIINIDHELLLITYSDDDSKKETIRNMRDICLAYINMAPVVDLDLLPEVQRLKKVTIRQGEVIEKRDKTIKELISDLEGCAPIIHAHWDGNNVFKCSNCGTELYPSWDYVRTPYCPYCGAKMDEEEIK